MDDDRKFEIYRLSVVQSMPDSDVKDVLIRAIQHKLKVLDADGQGEMGQATHRSG